VLGQYANDIFNRHHFLHSIPIEIDSKYEISFLLEECAKWNKDRKTRFANRFQIAKELIKNLDKIILGFDLN
jgi:hypothetical protein